jgi:arylsulfatase
MRSSVDRSALKSRPEPRAENVVRNTGNDKHPCFLLPEIRLMVTLMLGIVLAIPAGIGRSVAADSSESKPSDLPAQRPNIIVIVCDDMGFSDIGCYGSEIETPNLDRLAANGIRFVDFHNNAKCSESRASLLTGLWHRQSKNLKAAGNVTLAEVLRSACYRTLMSGKWHLASTPPERGFDRYFGFLSGAINFFTGVDWQTGKNLMRLDSEEYQVPADFYSTDAFTDHAINFLGNAQGDKRNQNHKDQPFFLYLAHNAPHFPLHARPEDIAKYKGRYRAGWDAIREQRFERLQESGLIDDNWRMSVRDPKVEAWASLNSQQREFLEPMMEVYAAMVDRLDQNIGRLVQYLKSTDQFDNTLILFFSDNGACPYERLNTPGVQPGSANSDIAYDARWANMCNTPLRLYKQYAHEGGTLTPMIAHWPNGIKARGSISKFTSHLVDLMPTFVELSGAQYPTEMAGQKILPMEGISLTPAFEGSKQRGDHPIFWEYSGNHAIRDGKWKLVAERSRDWELHDLSVDRCETIDLSDKHPDIVQQLATAYNTWAARTGAKSHKASRKIQPSSQSQLFDFKAVLDPQ